MVMRQLHLDFQSRTRSSYIVLIGFSSQIESEIFSIKRLVERKFGDADKIKSTPHLTMLHFIASDKSLSPIAEVLKNYRSKIKSNILKFNGFNSFRSNKLLFLDLEQNVALCNISAALQKDFKLASPEIAIRKQVLRPHVSIAQYTNSPQQFQHAVELTKEIKYQKSITPKSIVIFDQDRQKEVWRHDLEEPAEE